MCHIDLWFLYAIFIVVFAHLTDGEVLILRKRNYDEPLYIKNLKSYLSKQSAKLNNHMRENAVRPKRMRSNKHAILHYGRHIYHLDDDRPLTAKRNSNHKSYDYININDLVRTKPAKNNHEHYVKDLLILSEPPIHFKCDKHGKCDEDYRKFSKISKKSDLERKHKRMPVGHSKRFRIVDNRMKKRPKKATLDRNSLEDDNDKKRPPPIFNKNKYTAATASRSDESGSNSKEAQAESQGDESGSEEQSASKEREKNSSGEDSGSNEGSGSQEKSETQEKSGSSDIENNASTSGESWEIEEEVYESKSKSVEEHKESKRHKSKLKLKQNEESSSESESESSEEEAPSKEVTKEVKKRNKPPKKRRKKKLESEQSSEDQNRKRFDSNDVVLQGNKIFKGAERSGAKHDDIKRRRLQQFMPKRYHWEASEVQDLGYFWFNGPKGVYPETKPLS